VTEHYKKGSGREPEITKRVPAKGRNFRRLFTKLFTSGDVEVYRLNQISLRSEEEEGGGRREGGEDGGEDGGEGGKGEAAGSSAAVEAVEEKERKKETYLPLSQRALRLDVNPSIVLCGLMKKSKAEGDMRTARIHVNSLVAWADRRKKVRGRSASGSTVLRRTPVLWCACDLGEYFETGPGDMDAARRYYEEGIQVLETREGGVTSHGLLCLSSFAVFLDETIGDLPAAQHAYVKAIALGPRNPTAICNYAFFLHLQAWQVRATRYDDMMI
jgi:hypothetical protein